VKRKLAEGLSLDQIESESNDFSRQQAEERSKVESQTPVSLRGLEYAYSPYNSWFISHQSGAKHINVSLIASTAIGLMSTQLFI